MAKNIPLSTIGVKVSYAVETTAGTRPTTGYKKIHGLYSTPDFNIAPNTADATSFDEEDYTRKLTLLREMPDTVQFGVRFGQTFATEWEALRSAYKTGIETAAGAKETWFCIDIKGYDKALYFTGEPLALGIPAMEANSGIDHIAYIAPTSEPVPATKPTAYDEDN